MKRCPECGFRVKDPIRLCPLCGVRMQDDHRGTVLQHSTHSHQQPGERCMLPNKTREEAEKERRRMAAERPERTVKASKPGSYIPNMKAWSGKQTKKPTSSAVGIVVALVLYVLMQSCQAFS